LTPPPIPSPRLSGERVRERGSRLEKDAPPLPGPLLHSAEEREQNGGGVKLRPVSAQ